MPISFGLVVQRLPRRQDRVLAVGHLVGVRAGDGWFSPGDIADMFEILRLPRPGNTSQELARLREHDLVLRRRTGGSWSLTPEGDEAIAALIGDIDATAVGAELAAAGTADLDGVEHPLIPPELAPMRFQPSVRRLLDEFPFERNVFCMTRFPVAGDANDPVATAVQTLRSTLSDVGLTLHLASDRNADDELFGNVAAHIWACKYGVALLETRDPRGTVDLNDNVLIEVGAMLVTGRRCALLKDHDAPDPPTDFVAQIYKSLDLGDSNAITASATQWVRNDLGIGR